jgi:hypothetical protein
LSKRWDLAVRHWIGVQFYGKVRRFDLIAATLAITVISIALWRLGLFDDLSRFLDKEGTGIYGALLSAWASLLGFAIAAITIVSALVATPHFTTFRRSEHYDSFWFAFIWTIRSLGAAAVVALIGLFANHYNPGRIVVFIVAAWATILSAISLLRSGLTLEELLRQSHEAETQSRSSLKPSPNPPVEP